MVDLTGWEHLLLDLSQVKDSRYKEPGMYVGEDNRGRCTAALCEWIVHSNAAWGGTSPYPYGLYFLKGDPAGVPNLPADCAGVPFVASVPCDSEDPRAVKLTWNETGTEALFSFAALAVALNIPIPKGASIWIPAYQAAAQDGRPLILLPLADKIQRRQVQEAATGTQDAAEPQP